jgi:hypothetical protein
MTATPATSRFDPRLLIGPGLLVLGLASLKLSDVLVSVGPLDRAQFGWSVPVPMLLLAPGMIGVAARWSGRRSARRVAVTTGALFGIVLGVAWFAGTTQVGCDPHPALATRILAAIPIPLVLGVGWALAGWAAIGQAERPFRAIVVGAAVAIATGVVMIVVWAALFPGVTCAPGAVPVG